MEPVVTFFFPELKGVCRLEGKHKVRFEVVWVQTKGCMTQKTVIHTIDTPVIELWCEKKAVKPKDDDEDTGMDGTLEMAIEDPDMQAWLEGLILSGL